MLVTALAVGLTQLAGGASSEARTASVQSAGPPLQTAIGTYSVFARAAAPADDVSGWRIHEDRAGLGLRFSDARVVYSDSVRTVAAVPASDGPCLLAQYKDGSGGFNCGGPNRVSASLGYNGALLLVPDSVQTVTYTMTDGTTQMSPVANNVAHSPVEAAKVAFTLGERTVQLDLMPRSSLPKGATLTEDGMVTGGSTPGYGG